jgi:hypothetical protein
MSHEEQDRYRPIPWWHSLMYSTGIMLLICAIPVATAIALSLRSKRFLNISGKEALVVGGSMLAAVSVLGAILLFVARLITKHQRGPDEKKD